MRASRPEILAMTKLVIHIILSNLGWLGANKCFNFLKLSELHAKTKLIIQI